MAIKRLMVAVAVAGAMAFGLQAEMAWTTGSYTPASWTPAANNVLKGLSATRTGEWHKDDTCPDIKNAVGVFTDGSVPGATVDYTKIAALKTGSTLAWTFKSGANLSYINIYSRWGSGGRDGICITKVEVKYSGSDSWVDLEAPKVAYGTKSVDNHNGSAQTLKAVLAQSDGTPLAKNATALRLTFGIKDDPKYVQDNNGTGYVEIEAVATGPVWTVGTYGWDTWQADPLNLVPAHSPKDSSTNPKGWASQEANGVAVKGAGSYIASNGSFYHKFNIPVDISALHLYSGWQDSGRDGLNLKTVQVMCAGETAWTDTDIPGVYYDPGNGRGAAIITAAEGADWLFENVIGVKFNFGEHENNGVGFQEVEYIGLPHGLTCDWRTGKAAPADYANDFDNRAAEATITVETAGENSSSADKLGCLVDGSIATEDFTIGNNSVHCWSFPEPFDLKSVKFVTGSDAGHDGISIVGLSYKTSHDDVEWTPVTSEREFPVISYLNGPGGNGQYLTAEFKQVENLPLAEGITDLRISFGLQEGGCVNFREIEVVEWFDPDKIPNKLGEVSASVTFQTVSWQATPLVIGSGENKMNLYVSTDGGETYGLLEAKTVTDLAPVGFEHDFEVEGLDVNWYIDLVNTCKGWSCTNSSPVRAIRTLSNAAPVGEIVETRFANTNSFIATLQLSSIGVGATTLDVTASVYSDEGLTQVIVTKEVAHGVSSVAEPIVVDFAGVPYNTDCYVAFALVNNLDGAVTYSRKVRLDIPDGKDITSTFTWIGWGDGKSWTDPFNWGNCTRYPTSGFTAAFPANSTVELDFGGASVSVGTLYQQDNCSLTFKNATFNVEDWHPSLNDTLLLDNTKMNITIRAPLHSYLSSTNLRTILRNGSQIKGNYIWFPYDSIIDCRNSAIAAGSEFHFRRGTSSVFVDSEISSVNDSGGATELTGPLYFTNTSYTVNAQASADRNVSWTGSVLELAGSTTVDIGARNHLRISSSALTLAGVGADEPTVNAGGPVTVTSQSLRLDLNGMGVARHAKASDCDWTLFSSAGTLTFPAAWTNGADLAQIVDGAGGKVEILNAADKLKRYQLLATEENGVKALKLRYNATRGMVLVFR